MKAKYVGVSLKKKRLAKLSVLIGLLVCMSNTVQGQILPLPSFYAPTANSFDNYCPQKVKNNPFELENLAAKYGRLISSYLMSGNGVAQSDWGSVPSQSSPGYAGVSWIQAAGIIGNLMYQSNLNAGTTQASGMGIAGWSGAQQANFTGFASDQNISVSSQAANIGFLLQDLKTGAGMQTISAMKRVTGTSQDTILNAVCTFEAYMPPQPNPNSLMRFVLALQALQWISADYETDEELWGLDAIDTTNSTLTAQTAICGAPGSAAAKAASAPIIDSSWSTPGGVAPAIMTVGDWKVVIPAWSTVIAKNAKTLNWNAVSAYFKSAFPYPFFPAYYWIPVPANASSKKDLCDGFVAP